MTVIGTIASIGMAVGPPLIYVDQAYSIIKKKDSTGFSHDVCGVVIIANIIRVFFWLGKRFETPLLVQSILLIISQLLLLSLCLHYAPIDPSASPDHANLTSTQDPQDRNEDTANGSANESGYVNRYPSQESSSKKGWKRPMDFWQWEGYGSYLEFLAGLIVIMGLLQIIFGRWMWYIDALGFIALSIESTLPIPQFISNYKRKSTYGLRASTLAGWFFGDAFKTGYFFLRHSPLQFQITAIMTLCWDSAVFAQRLKYGTEPPRGMMGEQEHQYQNQGFGSGEYR